MKYYFSVFSNYAKFSGRARRSEYWYFTLFHICAAIVASVIDLTLGTVYLYSIYALIAFLPSLAVGVRRMHDVNKSGWFLLIPIYNLVLACSEGTRGSNDYGQDPKGEEFAFEFEQKAA